eukprot:5550669-Pyramimonas_sp.AAC.1
MLLHDSHRLGCSWGAGTCRSPSDSAFSSDLAAEAAPELKGGSFNVLTDVREFFELVIKSRCLLTGAQATGAPARLAWMVIKSYVQPCPLRAPSPASIPVASPQGVLA